MHQQELKPTTDEQTVAPKAFISHASQDKDRFVRTFAVRLRHNGIEAWLDEWEMNPGDNLISRIYDEGIKNADTVIAVISRHSLKSHWVHDELSTAKVEQVQGRCRLIPVILDTCRVPACLTATVHQRIRNTDAYDLEFARIVRAIFGESVKPPLGSMPTYVRASSPIPGLDLADSAVLKLACEQARRNDLPGSFQVGTGQILPEAKVLGIEEDAVYEALSVLSKRGYIDTPEWERISYFTITFSGWEAYGRANLPGYEEQLRRVAAQIVNEGEYSLRHIAQKLELHPLDVEHALEWLQSQGFFKLRHATSPEYGGVDCLVVPEVFVPLKRWLNTQHGSL